MRKSIFPVLLCCNLMVMAAQAAINPIPLLTQQCLRLSLSPLYTNQDASIASSALIMERELLGLNNINDRIAYYRNFPLNGESRTGLLKCQLHLADVLTHTLGSASLDTLITRLEHSEQQVHVQLALRLNRLRQNLLPDMVKSRLYTAQASVLQGLRSQTLDFTIVAPRCQLPDNEAAGSKVSTLRQQMPPTDSPPPAGDFSRGIAAYLMQQRDPVCRQAVWQAYQGRASERNRETLARVYQIRRQQARSQGFDDYAQFALSDEILSTPALVKTFLDSQTQSLNMAPWDLGKQLAALPAPSSLSVAGNELLERVHQTLTELGLSFEAVNEQITRVWHKGRLLGELYLNLGDINSLAVLRYPVIGQQFGQLELSIKPQLHSAQDINAALKAIARGLAILGSGSQFYLLGNTTGQDSTEIATRWLTEFLRASLPSDILPQDARLTLMSDYQTQLQVFRAKVALNQFQRRKHLSYTDLGGEFYAAFGVYWPQTNDYQYSFGQLASDGPSYYHPLWHQALADLIVNDEASPDVATIFDVLVVNEASHPLEAQLQTLIGAPVDPLSLIQRIQHATKNQATAHLSGFGRDTGTTEP
jgi:hypothetical protein